MVLGVLGVGSGGPGGGSGGPGVVGEYCSSSKVYNSTALEFADTRLAKALKRGSVFKMHLVCCSLYFRPNSFWSGI